MILRNLRSVLALVGGLLLAADVGAALITEDFEGFTGMTATSGSVPLASRLSSQFPVTAFSSAPRAPMLRFVGWA